MSISGLVAGSGGTPSSVLVGAVSIAIRSIERDPKVAR